jgi:hypothetical protein
MAKSLPVAGAMRLYTNGVVPWPFKVVTKENAEGWLWQGYVFDRAAPTVPVLTFTILWDGANKIGNVLWTPGDVALALAGADEKELEFVILTTTDTGIPVPFYSGPAVLVQGGPVWV